MNCCFSWKSRFDRFCCRDQSTSRPRASVGEGVAATQPACRVDCIRSIVRAKQRACSATNSLWLRGGRGLLEIFVASKTQHPVARGCSLDAETFSTRFFAIYGGHLSYHTQRDARGVDGNCDAPLIPSRAVQHALYVLSK